MDKIKKVFSSHKHSSSKDESDVSKTEKLYQENPEDLNTAYHMGKGDLGGGAKNSSVAGLADAPAAGNVYEASAIPEGTRTGTMGEPIMGTKGNSYGKEIPSTSVGGASRLENTSGLEPRDELSYPIGTDSAALGTGAGLTGATLADRSVGGSTFDDEHLPLSDVDYTGGPHPTFTGNRLDPNFQEDIPSYHTESAHTHSGTTAGLTGTSGGYGQDAAYTSGSHLGRDAGVVGGVAVGGAAAAAYEADSNPQRNITGSSTVYGSSNTDAYAGTPAGATFSGETSASSGNHYGRDAAAVGGVGAVGAAAYEYEQPSTTTTGREAYYDPNPSNMQSTGATGFAYDGQSQPSATTTTASPVTTASTGTEKKSHGLSSLLHRDSPNKLHKDPPTGSDSNLKYTEDGRLIEPRTGLPINIEKYGTASGGTDGAKQIHLDPQADATQWDKVAKANTPY